MKSEKRKKQSLLRRVGKDLTKHADAYIMVIPVIIFYILFCYKPMYGVIIAFKDYSPAAGVWGSKWADSFGFRHFIDFFSSYYFKRVLRNTLVISLSSIVFGFPAPIIFALMLNEIKNLKFKKMVQTISYMPHFISMIVVASLIKFFVSDTGVITSIITAFGGDKVSMLAVPKYFVPIYVISGIWQELGWGAIIYLSALAGIDQELYEAARIDGANRWKQTLYVTLPGISGTVIIMLLLRIGSIMSVGYEKIILLYNPGIYETADVISTFVYRKGLLEYEWSYSTAVGIFNSIINFVIVVIFNKVSRKVTEVSLW